MGAAAFIPLGIELAGEIPTFIGLIESAIHHGNATKKAGASLTPAQASATNQTVTQVAQLGLSAAVANGAISQATVDSLVPAAANLSALVQAVYAMGNKPATSTPAPMTPGLTALQQALIATAFPK